jgi:hypothetical protein
MEINFANLAQNDATFVATLIANGEMERAYRRTQLLLSTLELVMENQGITPSPITVHDSTVAR